jgi:hypothetical protein
MTIEDKVREIMLSKELPDSEKLDQLHALIPPDVCKIDSLKQATPAQLRRLKDGLAVTEAMQQIRRRTAGKEIGSSWDYMNISIFRVLPKRSLSFNETITLLLCSAMAESHCAWNSAGLPFQ